MLPKSDLEIQQSLSQIQECLLFGKLEGAYKTALDSQMWPHALLLSRLLSPDTFLTTIVQFVTNTLPEGSPLRTFYLLLADKGDGTSHWSFPFHFSSHWVLFLLIEYFCFCFSKNFFQSPIKHCLSILQTQKVLSILWIHSRNGTFQKAMKLIQIIPSKITHSHTETKTIALFSFDKQQ